MRSSLKQENTDSQRSKHFKYRAKVLGQFFTPQEVADFIVSFASLHLKDKVSACDPACGDGVFLNSMLGHGFREVVGIDIDAKCIESIPGSIKERASLFVGDALRRASALDGKTQLVPENYFDLVAGNPPFSAKYGRVRDKGILSAYKMGYDMKSQAVEVLFLERFIQLAREGGIIAIILPDGVFLNLNYRRIREFIMSNCEVIAVISLPRAIFRSSKSTTSKTSILFLRKGKNRDGKVFMAFLAEANVISDLERILNAYKNGVSYNAVWAAITPESLHPKIYLGNAPPHAAGFKSELPLFRLGELIKEMFCGSTEYREKRRFVGEGIPFISAKVITPLGVDFAKNGGKYIAPNSPMDKKRAHVKIGDVLFVRVGVGCIGRAAVVIDEKDLGIADDWIYVIRVKEDVIRPSYLAVFLQTLPGRMQIENAMRGVGTMTVPQRLLKNILVPIPEHEFQDALEKKYREMVDLRRDGKIDEAWKIFREVKSEVEQKVWER